MASPATGDAPNGITTPTNPNAGGQGTPPSSSAAPANTSNSNNNATTPTDGAAGGAAASSNNAPGGAPSNNNSNGTTLAPSPAQPPTSISDSGLSKRPKDARLLHMVLAHQGVQAYQERVPLQLLDFAYRYTAGVLSDAVSINAETAPTSTTTTSGKGSANAPPLPIAQQEGSVSLGAVRSAIASRLNYQFNPTLPKDFLLELAAEKNRVGLPRADREYGVRLPPERYCFTGAGWNLKEEWESEVEDEADERGDAGDVDMVGSGDGLNGGGDRMEGVQMGAGAQQEGDAEDEDEQDEFEEVMGVGSAGGSGVSSGGGGDSQMMDA